MDRIRFVRSAPPGAHAPQRLGRVLTVVVTIGLALVIIGSLVFGVAVRVGIAPDFDQRIRLDAQHTLAIHNGAIPTCTPIPNPPYHGCFWPSPARRAFSVDYLTLQEVQSLLWFQLPSR